MAQPVYPPPSGVYCSCGPTTGMGYGSVNPSIAAKTFVKGILVRVSWELCEPTDNNYNWNLIDGQIAAAKSYGKKISLGIGSGGGIPQWVFALGATSLVPTIPPMNDSIAVPWDSIYLNKWTEFIAALGNHYQTDTTIQLVYITNSSTNGFEMQLPYSSTPSLAVVGYSDTKIILSWKTVVDAFDSAFPNHYLTNDFHPVNGSNAVADSIYQYAQTIIGQRYGANAWWWTQNNTAVYPDQYQILQHSAANNSFAGVQFARSGTADSALFGPGGMPGALQMAVTNKICHWELWNEDILNPLFDSLLSNVQCKTINGVKEDILPQSLSILPNPATKVVQIGFNNNLQIRKVAMANTFGNLVKEMKTSPQSKVTIDIADLDCGLYIVIVQTENKAVYRQKLIIE